MILGEVAAAISCRKNGTLGAREYIAYHKPDDTEVEQRGEENRPLADNSTQYSYLYIAKWTPNEGVRLILEQPISARDVGLRLHCPRFDRDIPEFFVFEAQKDNSSKMVNSSSWVNLITQIERTIIQVCLLYKKVLIELRCTLGTRIISMELLIYDGD